MAPSMFTQLCDIADALDRYARDLAAGPARDRLEDLALRLDAVIEQTVGLAEMHLASPEP